MAFHETSDGALVALAALEIERIVIRRVHEPAVAAIEAAEHRRMWTAAADALAHLSVPRELWYVMSTRPVRGVDGSTLRTAWIAVGRGRTREEAAKQCEDSIEDLRMIYGACLDFLVTAPVRDVEALLDLVRHAGAPFVCSFRRRPWRPAAFVPHATAPWLHCSDVDLVTIARWSDQLASWLPLAEALASSSAAAIVVRVAAGIAVPSVAIEQAMFDIERIGRRQQEVLGLPVRDVTVVPNQFEALLSVAGARLTTLEGPCLAADISLATWEVPEPSLLALVISTLAGTSEGPVPKHSAPVHSDLSAIDTMVLRPGALLEPLEWRTDHGLIVGSAEAIAIVRTVDPPADEMSPLPCSRSRVLSLRHSPAEGTLIGTSEGRGSVQHVRLDESARFQHVYIVGQTGTGKSTLMLRLALADIDAGAGVTVLDPHGSLVDAILERVPPKRAGDVMLMAPGTAERYLGANPLDFQTDNPSEYLARRDQMIDELLDTFDAFYDMKVAGGPIFEQYFRVFMGLICGSRRPDKYVPILPMIALAMQDKQRINALSAQLGTEDPVTADLLRSMTAAHGEISLENCVPYVTSKLNRYYASAVSRRVLCQNSTLDYSAIIRNRRILLVKLHKGHLGSDTAALLARQLIAGLTSTAFRIPAEERTAHFIYADEFHTFATERFAMLMSEARKFRLGLVLAHQFTSQLRRRGEQTVLDAVLGNVGTVVAFRVGSPDAELLSGVMAPRVNASDITSLPNYSAFVRSAGALGNIPFLLRTSAPPPVTVSPSSLRTMANEGLTACEADVMIAKNLEAFRELVRQDD